MKRIRYNATINESLKRAAEVFIAERKGKTGRQPRNFSELVEQALVCRLREKGVKLPLEFALKPKA